MKQVSLLFVQVFLICAFSCTSNNKNHEPEIIERNVVYQEDGYFLGWPSNNGIWMWEDGEIMVGFTRGRFVLLDGHHIGAPIHHIEPPYESWLARSTDGGFSWEVFIHEGFAGESPLILKDIMDPLNFKHKDFAMRVTGVGYHGTGLPEGGFFYSYNRGKNWEGPIPFNGLSQAEELKDLQLTGRTEYIIESNDSALFFMGARDPLKGAGSEKAFLARTTDGGLSFEFLSWIGDRTTPSYAIMPTAAKTFSGKLVASVRKRDYKHNFIETNPNPYGWIDIYASDDNGITWEFLCRAAETGPRNGNPPKLIQLSDGRLCLVYGNREDTSRIIARFSFDEGKNWGPEIILREGNETDIGYPQMIQKEDGTLVTIYYWATSPVSEKYIESTIWDPGKNWGNPIYIKNFDK